MKKDKCQLNEYFDEKKGKCEKKPKYNLIKNVNYQINIMMIN